MMDPAIDIMPLVLLLLLALAFFVPAMVAFSRGVGSRWGVLVFNLVAPAFVLIPPFWPWPFAAWVFALIWALSGSRPGDAAERVVYYVVQDESQIPPEMRESGKP